MARLFFDGIRGMDDGKCAKCTLQRKPRPCRPHGYLGMGTAMGTNLGHPNTPANVLMHQRKQEKCVAIAVWIACAGKVLQ